jgi:hypothetical protein
MRPYSALSRRIWGGCATGSNGILHAIVDGRSQPEHLAELALGRLQEKKTELALALDGRYTRHFRWLLES